MKGDPMDGEPTRYMRSHAEDDLGCPMRSEEVTVHWPRRDAPGGMGWESRQDSEGAPLGPNGVMVVWTSSRWAGSGCDSVTPRAVLVRSPLRFWKK